MSIAEIIKICVCLFIAILWSGIGLVIRHYPDIIAGYNTMPHAKRDKIDIRAIGSIISLGMFVGAVSMLIAPFMPYTTLFNILLLIIPISIIILLVVYITIFEDRFKE